MTASTDAPPASSILGLRRRCKMDAAIDRLLACFSCRKSDFRPITGPCGHTRCYDCCHRSPRCSCGQVVFLNMSTDVTLHLMIEKRQRQLNDRIVNVTPNLRTMTFYPDGEIRPSARRQWLDYRSPINRNPRRSSVRQNPSWRVRCRYMLMNLDLGITADDLICRLCIDTFVTPVVTPCGHTYCKTCLQRLMDYNLGCPLCRNSFRGFYFGDYCESKICRMILSILQTVPRDPPDDLNLQQDELPILICMVSYPAMNCPLLITEPYNRTMIRWCMQKDQRVFGIVSPSSRTVPGVYQHGTLLEIKDAIQCKNGDYIVTALGLSRFKVKKWTRRHGYYIGVVETTNDDRTILSPTSLVGYHDLVRANVKLWLDTAVPRRITEDIRAAYGKFPDLEPNWMTMENGPKWIWWTLSVLPLSNAEKTFCHQIMNIHCRILAIDRAVSTLMTTHCQNKRQLALMRKPMESTAKLIIHSEDCPQYNRQYLATGKCYMRGEQLRDLHAQ